MSSDEERSFPVGRRCMLGRAVLPPSPSPDLQSSKAVMPPPPSLDLESTRTDHLLPPPADSPWIISIREKLVGAQQYEASSTWTTQSIYRVPKFLRDVDETAYTPQIVSLGPYHHGRLSLRKMDLHKWRALHHALARTGHDVRLYLDVARSLENRARACYEAPLYISSDDFVESLVLDSIFVLELFRGVADQEFRGYDPNDPVFCVRITTYPLQRDMIMLENQLPLFVLDHILALQLGPELFKPSHVAMLAVNFFHPLRLTNKQPTESSNHLFDAGNYNEALHCLDVFRRSLRFPNQKQPSLIRRAANKPLRQFIPCAVELKDAGVKFKRRKSDHFWDIKFEDGLLQIPRIRIHDSTKSLFLNLIAFEQCHLECSNHITSYVIFMDNLINSEVDVRYLHYKGIIEHWLGSDVEVADLFNQLSKEVIFETNDSYLLELSEQLNSYYNRRWNVWRASFIHKYFRNPWTIISLVAAIVLILLTFAQTFYDIYGYYKPS